MSMYYQPEIETMPYAQLRALQNERFLKQVRHVWENVPYYRKKMEEASADSNVPGCEEQWEPESDGAEYAAAECGGWWGSEPAVGRVADGVAYRVDRLRALGNGQVPLVAAVAFCELRRVLSEYGGYECD